ncbi:MAG: hypothetical protein QOI36_5483, partial [Pseudonocardiales bacterium]|nr:hypothetical protein [Pseudonocardiales bacterium]
MLRSSYSSYYGQMLPPLRKTLDFKSNNTAAYRPVMDALAQQLYDAREKAVRQIADLFGVPRS